MLQSAILKPSVLSLVFANLVTIVLAVFGQWNLGDILWVYWLQSIIIGFFQFLKIISLKEFSTENFRINKRSVLPTEGIKIFTALFFAFHYGFFHFVYLVFLAVPFIVSGQIFSVEAFLLVLFSGAVFFFNHLFSFMQYRKNQVKRNIGHLMFFPYARIVPMHLTIVFGVGFLGSGNSSGLVFFMMLKTVADVAMHMFEHKIE